MDMLLILIIAAWVISIPLVIRLWVLKNKKKRLEKAIKEMTDDEY